MSGIQIMDRPVPNPQSCRVQQLAKESVENTDNFLKALVVDESVNEGNFAADSLLKIGFTSTVLNDSQTAANFLAKAYDSGDVIDLLVTELSFVDVPGAIFLAQCRYLYPDIVIVVYSAQTVRPCDRIAMRWNSNRFVDKRAGLEELAKAVREVCPRS